MQEEKTKKKPLSPKMKQFLQFLTFTGFSISAGVIQLVSNGILSEWTGWLDYWVAYMIALILSVVWNFTFNRKFTFRSASNIPLAMGLVIVYYAAFTPLSTFGAGALEKVVNEASGKELGLLVTAIMMIINFATEFLWDKFLVFNDKVMAKIEKFLKIKNRHISQENIDLLRKCDALIVGAGLSGAIAARALAEKGKKVSVVEYADELGKRAEDDFTAEAVRTKLNESGFNLQADAAPALLGELLTHPSITLFTGKNALLFLKLKAGAALIEKKPYVGLVVYTDKLDMLLREEHGALTYPVPESPTEEQLALYAQYRKEADETAHLYLLGPTAEYSAMETDAIIEKALSCTADE